jgi:hypothetical protein
MKSTKGQSEEDTHPGTALTGLWPVLRTARPALTGYPDSFLNDPGNQKGGKMEGKSIFLTFVLCLATVLAVQSCAIAGLTSGGDPSNTDNNTTIVTRADQTYRESWSGWAKLPFTDYAKYFLYNNIWGVGSITGWKQCIYGNGPTCGSFGWKWDWPDGGNKDSVKAYPEVRTNSSTYSMLPTQISAYKNINAQWNFSVKGYNGTGSQTGRGNVAWDIWIGGSASGAHTAEIMIWGYYWGYTSYWGTLIASNVSIEGHPWNIYYTNAPGWNYFAFRRVGNATNFTMNIKHFVDWLRAQNRVNPAHWIQTVEAGSEVKFGAGRVDTSSYYCTIQ